MKALLIADDDNVIKAVKDTLVNDGYDVITYRWLLKALDNIEEIAPEVIVVSASCYPRHWKTLVQFVRSGIEGFIPKIVLYTSKALSDDEFKKSEALNVNGIFNSITNEGLSELSDILSDKKSKECSLIFTNPINGAFITGRVSKYENDLISFVPDSPYLISVMEENQNIAFATIKSKNSIRYINAKVLSKTQNNSNLQLQVI